MTALAFESFNNSPRRNATRRSSRPLRHHHAPAVLQEVIAAIRDKHSQISKGNQLAIATLIVGSIALHLVILNAVNRQGPVAPLVPQPVPMAIEIAAPPPPIEPPKPLPQKIERVVAPAKVAPSVPVVRSDEPIDSTPSPDAVQVAAVAPAPASVPAPVEHVTEPRGYAGYLNNPAPAYPPAALLKGIQGHVILNVHVLASGHTEAVTVFKTSGQRILDDSAVKTVTAWLFEPAKRGDNAVDGWVKVPINFKIS